MSSENSSSNSSSKSETIKKYRVHENDTGSPEVQVALITERLATLVEHFQVHADDKHSKRGMMAMISRRKKLLSYLKRENVERYRATIAALGLRK